MNLGVFQIKKPSKYWVLKVSSGASRLIQLVYHPVNIDLQNVVILFNHLFNHQTSKKS